MGLTRQSLKRLMIFVDWYEPGFKGGGPIRSVANLVRNMSGSYELFIFTSDRDLGDDQQYSSIQTNTWLKVGNAKIFYASPEALNWSSILKQIKEIDPDLIYLNGIYAKYYAIYPLLIKKLKLTSANIILAPRGMLQKGALQFKTAKKKFFLKTLSILSIPKLITGHATDEQEKKDMNLYLPGIKKIHVIPNFSSAVAAAPIPLLKRINELETVFISRISPKKNLLFLFSLLKNLTSFVKVNLTIRGAIEDKSYWQLCKGEIKKLPINIKVNYDGPVDHKDIVDVLSSHHIFALPTEGENFGHAIFEALSIGRPVLISDQTPWRDLQVKQAGWDLPLNNSSAFVDVLNQVAQMDDPTFQLWCKGAHQLAKDYIEKSNIKEEYLKLFS